MSLVNELIKGLLPEEENKPTIAVYAGGFKPPTSGHFDVVKQALEENPEIEEFIILLGSKERDGISQQEALQIWEIYNDYLPFKVKIEPVSKPPIQAVYNYSKDNPTKNVLWVIGAREGNDEDFKDIASRTKSINNYPNLDLRTIVTPGGVSGTAARQAADVSFEKFRKFVPDVLSDDEKYEVYQIVADKIQESKNCGCGQNPCITYGITEGRKKKKDPKKGTGKKPKKSGRRLYTDEDPKDTVRVKFSTRQDIVDTLNKKSFKAKSHARQSQVINLIHQRTRAAYNRAKKPDVKKRLKTALDYITKRKEASKKKTQRLKKQKINEAIDSSKFDFRPYIASLTQHMTDNGLKLEPLPQVQLIHDDYENGENIFGNTAYYAPSTNIIVLFTYGRHPKDILRSYAHELVHVHQNMEDRLQNINTTDVNEDEYLEQLEREAYETGNIMFRSWTDSLTGNKLEEATRKLITEKKKKDPFGLNAYALELARGLEEEVSDYKVYLDMDGVIANFDKRFKDLSGMGPKEFESKYGKNKFWDFIDEDNKVSFWVGIPVMPGAKELVNAVKKYNYELLTAPSVKKQSYLGKILWVRNHSDVLGGKPRINFKKAKEKHLVKPQLEKTDILIDDREDTIDRWNSAGGTGIHYKNISQVLNDLSKLGL